MEPRTRRELMVLLEEVMNSAYAGLKDDARFAARTSLVKTYLVEAHRLNAATHDKVFSSWKKTVGSHSQLLGYTSKVEETDEQLFFTTKLRTKTGEVEMFVDASDPRFWLVHSASHSQNIDPIIRAIVMTAEQLDFAWLPSQLLQRIASMGAFRGLGLDYDRREVPDVNFEAHGAPVQFLKMQLWGNRAEKVLEVLRSPDAFPDATTLSKVRIKHALKDDSDSFALMDVKYDGKVTARGTSIQSYLTAITTFYRMYADKVRDCEARFTVQFDEDAGRIAVAGEPITFEFPNGIDNLPKFCELVFSGTQPFKLWGVPVRTNQEWYRVTAVDLHVGHRLNFEICREMMRVYLIPGSCGNTLIRLYTNLQHYYQSKVTAIDGSREPSLAF